MIRIRKLIAHTRKVSMQAFPERQLYFRANGVVRFVSLSGRIQMAGAAIGLGALVWVGFTSYNYLNRDQRLIDKDRHISAVTASNKELNQELRQIRSEIMTEADRLEKRQQYLQQLLTDDERQSIENQQAVPSGNKGATVTPVPQSGLEKSGRLNQILSGLGSAFTTPAQTGGDQNTNKTLPRINALRARLTALRDRQIKIADQLVLRTESQLGDINGAIRMVGLTEHDIFDKMDPQPPKDDTGGPYIPIETDLKPVPLRHLAANKDSVFTLFRQQQKLDALSGVLASIPVVKPVKHYYLSSGFGKRIDPMRKTTAWHAGVDMAGWWKTPVHVTANGIVLRAGRNGAYGNFIEISHGNGFKTRYGHLKKILVKKGQHVTLGEEIGLMGSTGRSTGPHLHYEVWFDGHPRNPIKFFKAAKDVLKIQQELNLINS